MFVCVLVYYILITSFDSIQFKSTQPVSHTAIQLAIQPNYPAIISSLYFINDWDFFIILFHSRCCSTSSSSCGGCGRYNPLTLYMPFLFNGELFFGFKILIHISKCCLDYDWIWDLANHWFLVLFTTNSRWYILGNSSTALFKECISSVSSRVSAFLLYVALACFPALRYTWLVSLVASLLASLLACLSGLLACLALYDCNLSYGVFKCVYVCVFVKACKCKDLTILLQSSLWFVLDDFLRIFSFFFFLFSFIVSFYCLFLH